uniref:Uncharacterized protein n=1 Tax=Zea mays TaxID=4577 RepID=A0A804PEA0_MAIZE
MIDSFVDPCSLAQCLLSYTMNDQQLCHAHVVTHSCWDVARLGQAYGIARIKNHLSSSCLLLIDYIISLKLRGTSFHRYKPFFSSSCVPLIDYIISLKLGRVSFHRYKPLSYN